MSQDDAIVRALQTGPAISVPEDFAARVMARLPRERMRRTGLEGAIRVRPSVGRRFAIAAVALVAIAMLVLAPHTRDSAVWVVVQMMLFGECGALVLWFSYRSAG